MVSRHSSIFQRFLFVAGILVGVSSCITVKDYQRGKPFVYKTNIYLTQQFSKDTADDLVSGLKAQLDDSMRVRMKSGFLSKTLREPPVYTNENADKSIIFMRALLNSLG